MIPASQWVWIVDLAGREVRISSGELHRAQCPESDETPWDPNRSLGDELAISFAGG
jgi:hypothetical protein